MKRIQKKYSLYSPLFIDELMKHLTKEPAMASDKNIVDEVRNHLRIARDKVDLAALNIQRGRDHGLQGFTKYEKFCSQEILGRMLKIPHDEYLKKITKLNIGFSEIDTFEKLKSDKSTLQKIKTLYSEVQDLDLFSGGLVEPLVHGGLVGKTFGCIIASQFERLKKCDRFWFESPDPNIGFTFRQLRSIKNITLASVLCENLQGPRLTLQKSAFELVDDLKNPLINCKTKHAKLDFEAWSDSPHRIDHSKLFCDVSGHVIKTGHEKKVSACTICKCPVDNDQEAECSAISVTNCQDLIDQVGLTAVMYDESCKTQCESYLVSKQYSNTLRRKGARGALALPLFYGH